MTPTQITDISAERVPAWTDARDQMIHACALQEHIIANAPVLPTSVQVNLRIALANGYRFSSPELDVDVYLHHQPAAVRAFREFLGGELTERPHRDDSGDILTELTGSLFGCTFRVWALGAAVSLVRAA